MFRFNHIHGTLWVGNLICIIRRFLWEFFPKRKSLFLSPFFSHMLLKWCQNISCCLLSNFTKRIVIIELYLNRRKTKDLRQRLLQSPHRDPEIAVFLPPGMWQTDENLKMNLQLNLPNLMKPLAAPYRSAQGSLKRNDTRHKRSV